MLALYICLQLIGHFVGYLIIMSDRQRVLALYICLQLIGVCQIQVFIRGEIRSSALSLLIAACLQICFYNTE